MSKSLSVAKLQPAIDVFNPGPIHSVHRISATSSWLSALIGIFLIIGSSLAFFFTFLDLGVQILRYGPIQIVETNTITLSLGILLILPGILTSLYGISNLYKTIVLCENGLEFRDKNRTQFWDWHEIEYFSISITNQNSYLIYPNTSYSFILIKANGTRQKIDNKYERIEELGLLISKKVNPILFEKALQKIRAGEKVQFGKITICDQGLLLMNKDFCAWNEIDSVEVKNGYAVIYKIYDPWLNH